MNKMGYHLKMLAEEQVDQTLYYDHGCTLELRECIHDHFEDMRPVYTKDEFLAMSDHWIAARKKYDEMGHPEPEEQNCTLHNFQLPGERLHHERTALEFARGGADRDGGGDTFHFHYRHVRTHLSKRDFNTLCDLWRQADKSYAQDFAETVDLKSENVRLGQVATEQYIPDLQAYLKDETIPRANPDDFWDMYLKSKELIRPEEQQRPDGGWLLDGEGNEVRTRVVPEDFNKRYLYTIYECINKYGYGEGPFKYDYVHVQRLPDDTYLVRGSHRVACLVVLGYTSIPAVVIN
jgi:hypothetical protein